MVLVLLLITFDPGFKDLFDLAVGCWRASTTLYPGGPEYGTRAILLVCLVISREMRKFTVLSELSKSLVCTTSRFLMCLRESER